MVSDHGASLLGTAEAAPVEIERKSMVFFLEVEHDIFTIRSVKSAWIHLFFLFVFFSV